MLIVFEAERDQISRAILQLWVCAHSVEVDIHVCETQVFIYFWTSSVLKAMFVCRVEGSIPASRLCVWVRVRFNRSFLELKP